MDKQQTQQQLERYQGYLHQDPDNTQLICQVAQLQLQSGDIDASQNTLNNALQKQPNDAGLQFNLASTLMAAGEYKKAGELLSSLNTLIDNTAIKYNLAYALLHSEQYDASLEHFSSIINKEDAPEDTAYWLGRNYYYLGDLVNALVHLSEHHDKNPTHVATLGTLAMLHMDMENLELARQFAESALAIDKNNAEALVTLGNTFLEQQDEEQALSFFTKASNNNPNSGRARSGLGLSHMLSHNIDAAIEELTKATQLMPSHLGTWHALAWAQLVTDKVDDARSTFEACMEVDRNFAETHGGLAVIDIIQDRKQSASERIKRALKLDRTSFSAMFAKSLLIQNSKPEEARKIIDTIMTTPLADGIMLKDSLNTHFKKHNNFKH